MNLEKTKLWTIEIRLQTRDHTWKGSFIQEPTYYEIRRAILMEIDELAQRLKNESNDESDEEWLYTQQERAKHVLQLWECLKTHHIAPAWRQVTVAGVDLGRYRTTTSEIFVQASSNE